MGAIVYITLHGNQRTGSNIVENKGDVKVINAKNTLDTHH